MLGQKKYWIVCDLHVDVLNDTFTILGLNGHGLNACKNIRALDKYMFVTGSSTTLTVNAGRGELVYNVMSTFPLSKLASFTKDLQDVQTYMDTVDSVRSAKMTTDVLKQVIPFMHVDASDAIV